MNDDLIEVDHEFRRVSLIARGIIVPHQELREAYEEQARGGCSVWSILQPWHEGERCLRLT
jgi:hypothetical protein